MKELAKLVDLSFVINDLTLFKDVSATIHEGDVIGIIGKNGAGKSTILQLLMKKLVPSEGHIQWMESALNVVMVEQEAISHDVECSSLSEVKLLERWQLPKLNYERLSGGEKVKARLVKGLSGEADLLLLDEPTNHLDQQGIKLLCEQLECFKGTIVLVSHDRYFLDLVTTKIWSLEEQTLYEHNGNYSGYMEWRRQRRLSQQRAYQMQQKEVERVEAQLKQLTSWSEKAHGQSTKKEGFKEYYRVKAKRMDAQIKSKQKRLEKELENANLKPVEPDYVVKFSMSAGVKIGKRFLEVKDLKKTFSGRVLFQGVQFTIQHGEKIALVGPNGSGKTTLLKMLFGNEPIDEGTVWVSQSAEIGYLTQEVFDLPLSKTPEQLFFRETFQERGKVQTLMKHLGFTSTQWHQPIGNMSMGERVKCKLMKFMLEEKDVLILDEPTNHLDLPSREQLEDTLSSYGGTLLVVSHDRYFIEKVTTSRLLISGGTIRKQFDKWSAPERGEIAKMLLTLENERQEVLGKLSFINSSHKDYASLDRRFAELTKEIQLLKRK